MTSPNLSFHAGAHLWTLAWANLSALFTLASWLFSRKPPDPGRPDKELCFVPRTTCLPLSSAPARSGDSAQTLQGFSISLGVKKVKVLINIAHWAWLHFVCWVYLQMPTFSHPHWCYKAVPLYGNPSLSTNYTSKPVFKSLPLMGMLPLFQRSVLAPTFISPLSEKWKC